MNGFWFCCVSVAILCVTLIVFSLMTDNIADAKSMRVIALLMGIGLRQSLYKQGMNKLNGV